MCATIDPPNRKIRVRMSLPRPPVAIIFDFDGVILDSTPLKSDAYVELHRGEAPEKLAELRRHETIHGGVTRRVKLAHYEKHLFGRSGDAESVERLAKRYSEIVFDAVMSCPFIPGAEDLLAKAHGRIDMHLVSGTPYDELKTIVDRRGLSKYFQTVQGAPTMKPEAFAKILAEGRYNPAQTLAIGDSITECVVAGELGIPFLGIGTHEERHFPADAIALPTLVGTDRLIGLA
jgi:phosphoglycolate phosphatase-like HAD superfamily hydrolase